MPRGLEPGETGVVFIVLLGGLLLGWLLLAGGFLPRHGELMFCLGRDPCVLISESCLVVVERG